MSLKSVYTKFVSLTLLAVMAWNVAGWVGMGFYTMYTHHHDMVGDYCEMDFCYCEISDGEKICTCHHPEMNRAMNHDETHHSDDAEVHLSHCYFTTPHTTPDASFVLITWDKSLTIIPEFQETEAIFTPQSLTHKNQYPSLPGFPDDLLRPPMA